MKYRRGLKLSGRCSHINFTAETFHRNNILKSTLAEFVFNCNKAVNSHIEIIAQLKLAVDRLVQENNQLKEDKLQILEDVSCPKSASIQSQNFIISLQNELLDCKDVQLDSVNSTVTDAVKTTVQTEMKSYSEAVSGNSGPSARDHVPDVKILRNVVKEVVQTEDRSRNLIVFGVKEEAHEEM